MSRDYRDLLNGFKEAQVDYLVVGAHAYAVHAEPRYTSGLDLWVRPTRQNAERVYRSLAEFGAPLQGVTVDDFATAGLVYQIGVEPVRVDIMMSLSGLEFDDAWARRVPARYGDIPIAILSLEDLITCKEAAGRPQDLVDVEVFRKKLKR